MKVMYLNTRRRLRNQKPDFFLQVKPILQFKTTMCPGSGNKYQYNYNGTCVPFTVSKSEPVEFKLQGEERINAL